jgi:hypothetical protein
MRHPWYPFWRRIALRAVRAARTYPADSPQREAAGYALHWAAMLRRASPDPRTAAHGIPRPTLEHNVLLARAESLAH